MSELILNLTSSAAVRGMVSPDGTHRFSVYDFICLAAQKPTESNYGRVTYARLISDKSEFKNEIKNTTLRIRFERGRGQLTPVATVEGLVKLLTILGDKVSQAFRVEAFDILTRYLNGDTSLCMEIHENKDLGVTKSYAKITEKVLKRAQELIENEANMMPVVSFVYGTKSAAFPGLIRIGRTLNMNARLASLNTSCAPAPHRVVAVAPTLDSVRDERTAHEFFASRRVEGEFFNITDAEVKAYFANHITCQFHLDMADKLVLMQAA